MPADQSDRYGARSPPSHLCSPQQHRCPPLDEELCHSEMATVKGIMQGRDTLTPRPSRIINGGTMVQEQAHNLWKEKGWATVRGLLVLSPPAAAADSAFWNCFGK